jgi:hypothetical protein
MSAVTPEHLLSKMDSQPEMLFGAASFTEKGTVQRRLQRDVGLAVKLMSRQMDSMIKPLIACRTKEEFCKLRDEIFPKYANACFAVSSMMKSVVTNVDHVEIIQESLSSIIKTFRNVGAAYLGSDGKSEVLFCLSTMKKAFGMVRLLLARPTPPGLEERDLELAKAFATNVVFFQLNFTCLLLAMSSEDSLNPEVLEEILEGLRPSVMAYAAIRQAMDIRGFSEERYTQPPDISWDSEDQTFATF